MADGLDYTGLEKMLKSGKTSPLFLLYGTEQYDIRRAIAAIKSSVLEKETSENSFKWRLCPVTANEIVSSAQIITFTGGKKCLVASDITLTAKALGDNYESVFDFYFANPNPDATVIFAFNESNIKGASSGDSEDAEGEKSKKSPSVFGYLKKLASKYGVTVNLSAEKSSTNTVREIVKTAIENGCEMDVRAAGYLVDCCSGNKDMIFNELSKLCSAKQNGKIEISDIDKYCSKTLEANALNIFDSILKNDADTVFNIVSALKVGKTDPIQIIGAISNSFCMYYLAKTAKKENKSPEEIKNRMGISPNYAKFLFSTEYKMSEEYLSAGLKILENASYELVSMSVDRYMILEQALIKILNLRKK